jgi:hypothetical protein
MISMKKLTSNLLLVACLLVAASAQAKIITVNTENNADFSPGVTNLVTAINALADGDTINFDIPGSGVHYLLTPSGGYPLITNSSVTLDGYSQPGAVPNSNPIHAANNAQLKIVLSSTNGNCTPIVALATAIAGHALPRPGFNANDYPMLAFFRGTNNWVKGFAFQSSTDGMVGSTAGPIFGLGFMADNPEFQPWPDANGGNWHVSGCWFGLDPVTGQPVYTADGKLASPRHAIDTERCRNAAATAVNYPGSGTTGVAAGSANPRAEFNVIISGWHANIVGAGYRFSGNFFNVLPDGMTNFDIETAPNALGYIGDAFIEIGRQPDNIVIGTDGDGVNDDQEGNVFGGVSASPQHAPAKALYYYLDFYYGGLNPVQGTNIVIAGNYFGVAVDGVTRFTNACVVMHSFNGAGGTGRFGSDFDGVSDALEANLLYNNYPFDTQFPSPAGSTPESVFDGTANQVGGMSPGVRLSFRGNVTVGNDLLPYKYANGGFTLLSSFTNYSAPFMSTAASIIPGLSVSSTTGDIIGTCASTNGGAYSNIFIDVYVLDPEGRTNGALFFEQDLSPDFVTTNGFPQGKTYLGTFVDNGPLDRDAAVGSFNFKASSLGLTPGTEIIVTANYSADPVGTHNGRVQTSNFSEPVTLLEPIKITSVTRSGSNVTITWTGGTAPFSLQKRSTIKGTWGTVQTGIATSSTTYSDSGDEAFYQVLGN